MINLRDYDYIVINSSAGKDSQAMTEHVVAICRQKGLLDRLVMVHCDLGRAEWEGTLELAQEHAAHYGIRFEVVRRDRDLLHQVEFERKLWPIKGRCYGTSDHKTSQVAKLHTRLARETCEREGAKRQVRIVDAIGLRSQESDKRSERLHAMIDSDGDAYQVTRDTRNVQTVKWYPIHDWSLEEVWEVIEYAGTRHHRAYDLGMSRLSCAFCVMARKSDLRIAAEHNQDLAREYLRIEAAIGHNFHSKTHSLADDIGDLVRLTKQAAA